MKATAQKNITVHDVAREAGVSQSTVSAVLNDYAWISASTRRRVLQAVQRLGYVPNSAARHLVLRKHAPSARGNIIVLMISQRLTGGLVNPIFAGVAAGAAHEVMGTSRMLDMEVIPAEYRGVLDLPACLRGEDAGGVIALGSGVRAAVDDLRRMGIPVVLVESPGGAADDIVHVDNHQAVYDAVTYLVSMGHRNIAYIDADAGNVEMSDARVRGYRDALRAARLKPDPQLVEHCNMTCRGGSEAMRRLLERRRHFSAVACINDNTAFGAIFAIREAGMRVPEDISVVGYDDVELAVQFVPALTTVKPPTEELGRRAVRRLLEIMRDGTSVPSHIAVAASLQIRDSVRRLSHSTTDLTQGG